MATGRQAKYFQVSKLTIGIHGWELNAIECKKFSLENDHFWSKNRAKPHLKEARPHLERSNLSEKTTYSLCLKCDHIFTKGLQLFF